MTTPTDEKIHKPGRPEHHEMVETLTMVLIDEIIVNPSQPRKNFNEEHLDDLAASIKSIGIIQPPIVRILEGSLFYELIAGERRVRAAKKAGLKRIPVIIKQINARLSAEAALIENIQRVDLNPIETAQAIKKLMEEFNLNQEEVAEKVGKKRSTIANYLRLISLPDEIKQAVAEGSLSIGHAKIILSLESKEEQKLLFKKIQKEHLSVRTTEIAAKNIVSPPLKEKSPPASDYLVNDLIERLQHAMGTKVTLVQQGSAKGRICIDYYSLDDLDRILALILDN